MCNLPMVIHLYFLPWCNGAVLYVFLGNLCLVDPPQVLTRSLCSSEVFCALGPLCSDVESSRCYKAAALQLDKWQTVGKAGARELF